MSAGPAVRFCTASDVREDALIGSEESDDSPSGVAKALDGTSARELMLIIYEVPRIFYKGFGAANKMAGYGALLSYWNGHAHTGRRKRIPMDIDAMVTRWKPVIVGLATAHDKDEADRYESQLDDCLSPILTAPIRDVREFAGRLLTAMKDDPAVPFLVWRAYEIWVAEFVVKAPDGDLITLKTDIASEIAGLVEDDIKPQLSTALIHALQWRSPERLREVKAVVEKEKAAGRGVRLKGKESCLFMTAGGTEDNPEICIQL